MRCVILLFVSIFYAGSLFAQGGGPPMITDDPDVVEFHKWEINSSFNLSISDPNQIAFPYLDVNYGIFRDVHLKIESGYIFSFHKSYSSSGLGDVSVGLKYIFLHQEKSFLSLGIYPQATITGNEKGFLFPLLLQKKLGRFLVGEDIGISVGENNYQSWQNGFLLGYQVLDKLELMGEFFVEKEFKLIIATTGYMNYGFRYGINNTFTILGSFGRQIITPANDPQEYFISYLGIQSSF